MANFKIIAHRGASASAPDNTAQAFIMAIAQEADLIETDVQLTFDGVLVLEHDLNVEGQPVAAASLAELRALKPDLLTVASALAGFGAQIPFCWEVKQPGIEVALVNLVQDLVPAAIWEQTEFTSFFFGSAVALHRLAPGNMVGWLTPEWNREVIMRARFAGLPQICPQATKILEKPDLVAFARDQGLVVRAWLVTAPNLVPQLAEVGVYGGTVNFPDEARAALLHASL